MTGDGMFMNYLYAMLEGELRSALTTGDGDISSTLIVRLLRTLLQHSIDGVDPPNDSISKELLATYGSKEKTRRSSSSSTALSKKLPPEHQSLTLLMGRLSQYSRNYEYIYYNKLNFFFLFYFILLICDE